MTKKKRNTIFIGTGKPTFPVPVFFHDFGKKLANDGYEVYLLVHHHTPIDEKAEKNLSIIYWPYRNGSNRILDIFFLIKTLWNKKTLAVISGHRETKLLLLMGWFFGVQYRMFWHHTLSSQTDLRSSEPVLLRKWHYFSRLPIHRWIATHAICPSAAAKEDLIRNFYVKEKKAQVIYNSILDPFITTHKTYIQGSPEERIVCAGNIDPSKGQDILIQAARMVANNFKNLRIYFLGSGQSREKFEKLAESLGVRRHCVWVGSIPHQDVLGYMKDAYVSICPSRMDNLPTVLIESMALGTPVIASKVGGISEILDDGVEGLLIHPDNPDDLANAINQMIKNPVSRKRMSDSARQRYLKQFEQKNKMKILCEWFNDQIVAIN